MEPAQVKRVTDEEWPLVKRSRSGPDAGDGFARLSGTQPHVFRGGLQWRGPSTYRMYCMQQDEVRHQLRVRLPTVRHIFCELYAVHLLLLLS